jgi:hypothetical protein
MSKSCASSSSYSTTSPPSLGLHRQHKRTINEDASGLANAAFHRHASKKMNAPHALQQPPGMARARPFAPARARVLRLGSSARARSCLRPSHTAPRARQTDAMASKKRIDSHYSRCHIQSPASPSSPVQQKVHSRSFALTFVADALSFSARARALSLFLSLSLPPFSHFLIVKKLLIHTHTQSLQNKRRCLTLHSLL